MWGQVGNRFYPNLIGGVRCKASQASQKDIDEVDNNTDSFSQKFIIPTQIDYQIMNEERERLKTFENFPINFMDKEMLARTGMFYTGEDDKCKCYFCDVEIGRWEETDCPIGEHMRFAQNCPLLRRRHTDNVPINMELLKGALPPVSYDVCGANDRMNLNTDSVSQSQSIGAPDVDALPTTSLVCMSPPPRPYQQAHPEYAVKSVRQRTFAGFPARFKKEEREKKINAMIEAGFFYTGASDRVVCFSCGCGLKDWEEDDDPWEQHALWKSDCKFLKLLKGEEFIAAIKRKFNRSDNKLSEESESSCSSEDESNVVEVSSGPEAEAEEKSPDDTNNPKIRLGNLCESDEEKSVQKKDEGRLCKICFEEEYNTLFIPCGHVVACASCASAVKKCPLCQTPFTNIVRAFFA